MTDQQRAAMQAALKTLEDHRVFVVSRERVKHPEGTELYDEQIAQLRAALAEPEAEPVAWGMPSSDGSIVDCIAPGERDREPGQYTVPLYTAPPRREWQSLTAEEREQFSAWMHPDVLARVEQALREKNGG